MKRPRRGTVMVVALIALVLLQLAVVAAVTGGARDQDLSSHRLEAVRAQYAAESALQIAIREVSLAADESGDGGVGSLAGGVTAAGPVFNAGRMAVANSIIGTTNTVTATAEVGETVRSVRAVVRKTPPAASGSTPGLLAQFYSLGAGAANLNAINWNNTPTAIAPVPYINFPSVSTAWWLGGATDYFAVRFTGKIDIPAAGTWTFGLTSDDRSSLSINGTLVVNNDFLQSMTRRSGSIVLTAGLHDIDVRFYEHTGGAGIIADYSGPGVAANTQIPHTAFSHTPPTYSPGPGLPAVFGYPHIASRDNVYVWGDNSANSSLIDGYDSTFGTYGGANVNTSAIVATNATASQRWQMSGRSLVAAEARVGAGGNPSTVIATWDSSAISGVRSAQPVNQAIVGTAVPAGMPASSGAFNQSTSQTINSNRRYSTFQLSGANTVLTISGNITIQVDGQCLFNDGVTLQINPGSSLRLFVGGTLNILNQARINPNGPPSNVWIFHNGPSNQPITLNDQTRTFAHLRSANATFAAWNQAEFHGTIRAANVTIGDKASIHLDTSLYPTSGGGGGGAGTTTITSWTEAP